MKICSVCKKNKHIDKFPNSKASQDGKHYRCKDYGHKDYIARKCKILEQKKQYYIKNKYALNAKSIKYYKANKDELQEKNRIRSREHYLNNKDLYKINAQNRRDRKKNANGTFTSKMKTFIKQQFNNKCFNCCSINNLCIDHHFPLIDGFPLSIGNAVLLCSSCNKSKYIKYPSDFYTSDKFFDITIKIAINVQVWSARRVA